MLTNDSSKEELMTSYIMKLKENRFIMISDKSINYKTYWIVDYGCSNHMTRDEKKLSTKIEYKGKRVVVIANNFKLSIKSW